VREALHHLAVLADNADGRSRPAVPDAGIPALVDQLQVLTDDALAAGADRNDVRATLGRLAGELGLKRN